MTWSCRCRSCDQVHDGPPFSWGFGAPAGWEVTTDPASRCWGELAEEQAILHCQDQTSYFILGNVWLPVIDAEQDFSFTVWISLSEQNFERAEKLWTDPDRVKEQPYFGWLCNEVPGYPSTFDLKTNVHSNAVGARPHVELEPTDHPLALEQQHGIAVARVIEIAETMEAYLAGGGS